MAEKKNIYEKLTAIQCELKAPKNQLNSFGGYKYRSCEDILEAVKPLLNKHDLTLRIIDEVVLIGDRYYIKATAILTDGKDVIETPAFAREALAKKGMDESQITGATSSYARKYSLNGMFLIDDTKDADATNDHKEHDEKPKKEEPKTEAKKPEISFDDLSSEAKEIMASFDLSSTIKVLSNCVSLNKDTIDRLSPKEANYLRDYYKARVAELKKGKGKK